MILIRRRSGNLCENCTLSLLRKYLPSFLLSYSRSYVRWYPAFQPRRRCSILITIDQWCRLLTIIVLLYDPPAHQTARRPQHLLLPYALPSLLYVVVCTVVDLDLILLHLEELTLAPHAPDAILIRIESEDPLADPLALFVQEVPLLLPVLV